MSESIINCSDPAQADVIILGAPYDRTSSFGKGADQGPQAIINCLHSQIEFFDRVSGSTPAENLSIFFWPLTDLSDHLPEQMVQTIREAYHNCCGKFVLMLGGEHSVTNGALAYCADRSSEITIVQIDAHADLRKDDSDYNDNPHGPYAHCAVMRRALDLGFPLVQVGIRAYSLAEQKLFSHPLVSMHEWNSAPPPIETILRSVGTEQIYLTIDVDGFDPSVMPATGTPVPGGLSWYYGVELIRQLCCRHQLVGADIVEVAPRNFDSLTEYSAAQLAYTIIGCWAKQRQNCSSL
jgi:agmatinase